MHQQKPFEVPGAARAATEAIPDLSSIPSFSPFHQSLLRVTFSPALAGMILEKIFS